MKTFIGILILSLMTQTIFARCPGNLSVDVPVESCIQSTMEILAFTMPEFLDDVEVTRADAKLFLETYAETGKVDFELAYAKELAVRIRRHANNPGLSAPVRSQFWTQAAGVHGKMFDKLRQDGMGEGKLALNALKTALELDPTNQSAAKGYAKTMITYSSQILPARLYVQKHMGIKIADEVRSAIKAMEDAKLTGDPLYKTLKSKL